MYKLLPQHEFHVRDSISRYGHLSSDAVAVHLQPPPDSLQEAIFAADSFWKLEAALGLADGVVRTATGYYGGTTAKPSYREVCEGYTGHTEAVRVIYDRSKTSFKSLCKIFFQSHDPTNKDYLKFGVGTHLRSAIFYSDEEQKKQAQESKVERQMRLNRRIVTKIVPCTGSGRFYLAENRHQKYYLQQHHVRLCDGLGLRSTEQFVDSHLACKLNGILAAAAAGGEQQSSYQNLRKFIDSNSLPTPAKLAAEEELEEMRNTAGTKT